MAPALVAPEALLPGAPIITSPFMMANAFPNSALVSASPVKTSWSTCSISFPDVVTPFAVP